jgi:TetR/AcrR family transcriptional regulator
MGVAERRQREKHERRCCILDAAARVFLAKGLAAATMDEIAHQAEVSKGTLYLYFKGKDELYLTTALRGLGMLVSLFEEAVSSGGTGLERVERLLRAHARFALENRDLFRIATSWITTDYSISDEAEQFSEYKAMVAKMFQHGVESIQLGQRDGTIRPELSPGKTSIQLWGATLGVLMLELNSSELSRRMPAPLELDALAASFAELALRAIRLETPA